MKELTSEQTQIAVMAFVGAQRHMKNAIEELRQMTDSIGIVNAKEINSFSPFSDRGGELSLSQISDRDLETYQKNLETGCWKMLIRRSGIMESVTEDDRQELEKNIKNGSFGAFSEENIERAFLNLTNNEGFYVKNVAKEAFRYFSPDFRNMAPIRQKTVKHCGSYGSISFSRYVSPAWEVLGKALLLLDHQPLPGKYGETIVGQMNDAVQKHQMEFECPYFKAKFYEKSLTAHLTFTRMDLINLINEIGKAA